MEEAEKGTDEAKELEPEESEVLEENERTEEIEEPIEVEKKRVTEVEKKKEEEEIVDEKFYTVPLGKAWIAPRNRRATRAVHLLKDFVFRHMKIEMRKNEEEETERLVISERVNQKIWSRGIQKPPRRIRVRAVKDKEGTVTLYLAEGD